MSRVSTTRRWTEADVNQVARQVQAGIAFPLKPVTFRGRPRKYGNKPIVVDGYQFDSKAEGQRYGELHFEMLAGTIKLLRIHPKIDLHVKGEKIGFYEPDFEYWRDGKKIVEDVKGVRTPLYTWKKRHLKAEYGIDICEINA